MRNTRFRTRIRPTGRVYRSSVHYAAAAGVYNISFFNIHVGCSLICDYRFLYPVHEVEGHGPLVEVFVIGVHVHHIVVSDCVNVTCSNDEFVANISEWTTGSFKLVNELINWLMFLKKPIPSRDMHDFFSSRLFFDLTRKLTCSVLVSNKKMTKNEKSFINTFLLGIFALHAKPNLAIAKLPEFRVRF